MKVNASSLMHDKWAEYLAPYKNDIDAILEKVNPATVAPRLSSVFRALEHEPSSTRCVIIGQDPYPTPGNAEGLAFSIPSSVAKIPQSLRNIFAELESDLDIQPPASGDLTKWHNNGVMLLNRVLTTEIGRSAAHAGIGWQRITRIIAEELNRRGAVAILWGAYAQELRDIFTYKVESVHPSPLSAYRGFFGSKPFSQVNAALRKQGKLPIDWSL